jgi:anaerobic selenocysteine-containing dehydrogenase
MKITRRDFLRINAFIAASIAAGFYPTKKEISSPVVKTLPVGPCRYCAIGCAILAQCEVDDKGNVLKVLALKGDPNSTVNRGVLCTKGFLSS